MRFKHIVVITIILAVLALGAWVAYIISEVQDNQEIANSKSIMGRLDRVYVYHSFSKGGNWYEVTYNFNVDGQEYKSKWVMEREPAEEDVVIEYDSQNPNHSRMKEGRPLTSDKSHAWLTAAFALSLGVIFVPIVLLKYALK
jgi:hypothetical protein